ncbi:MAG: hypothetical protein A3F68_04340 [Acidobacteria bacterium RIFCSPLOWO2_12_FULL_54_10]|nr:MAG: hypothetical protein A3F68_04340 [Acidobacteria bacterium RIFCSPLOWO2_12_FULL_54_10]
MMVSYFRRIALGSLFLMVCYIPVAMAQGDTKATRITLGSSSGTPGTSVVVPIYFTPTEGTEVGKLNLTVDFVSKNLKYSKMDPGIAAEMGNVDLATDVKEGKNDKDLETTTLNIVASFLTPDPPKGVPSGLLGYLTMKINDDALTANITLTAKATATELKTNKDLPVESVNATVDVLAPGSQPLVTCFIFSH